jgi:hypothetical protein
VTGVAPSVPTTISLTLAAPHAHDADANTAPASRATPLQVAACEVIKTTPTCCESAVISGKTSTAVSVVSKPPTSLWLATTDELPADEHAAKATHEKIILRIGHLRIGHSFL